MVLPLEPVTNLNGSAIGVINNNSDKLVTEFDKVIYRDGSINMDGPLDMDGNRLLNVANPIDENDVATLGSVRAIAATVAKGDTGPANSTYTSVADMQAAGVSQKSYTLASPTGSNAGFSNGLFLYQTGNFTGRTDVIAVTGVPLTTGALVRQSSESISYFPAVGPAISTKGFLDRQGIWAGASNEIQPAINYIEGLQKSSALNLAPGSNLIMTSTLTMDGAYSTINGNGSTLTWPTLSTNAILIRGSKSPPWRQAANVLEKIELRGPRADVGSNPFAGSIGINYEGIVGGENGPSHIGTRDVIIDGFDKGVRHGHNSYLNKMYNMNISNCAMGVLVEGSAFNTTENTMYIGGAIFNNFCAFRQADYSGSGGLFFSHVSFDYNLKLAEMASRASVHLNECWHEANPYTSDPITFENGPDGSTDGASFFATGGRWLLSRAVVPGEFNYWASVPPGAMCRIHPDFALRSNTASGIAFTGSGEASFLFRNSFDAHGNCLQTHTSKYGLIDGEMSATGVVDEFIYDDGAPITSQTIGANLTLSKSTAQAHSGPQSLKFTKTSGAGSPAGMAFAIPVNEGETIGRNLWYRKPTDSTMTGNLSISYRFGIIASDSAGRRMIQYADYQLGDETITLSSADTGWVKKTFPGNNLSANRAPRGATHAIVLVNGNAVSAGDIYFDDIWMGSIGSK